jgi:hypothetical protein
MPPISPNSEAALEDATVDLFRELGWQILDCTHEVVGEKATIGRACRDERFFSALAIA